MTCKSRQDRCTGRQPGTEPGCKEGHLRRYTGDPAAPWEGEGLEGSALETGPQPKQSLSRNAKGAPSRLNLTPTLIIPTQRGRDLRTAEQPGPQLAPWLPLSLWVTLGDSGQRSGWEACLSGLLSVWGCGMLERVSEKRGGPHEGSGSFFFA